MFDAFYTHVFANYFLVLGKNEPDFALLFVDEDFEKVHQFPTMSHKKTFVFALKYVKIPACKSDFTLDIPNNRLP